MNPSARPQTSRNRDRAVARIQSITTRTAVLASIATLGFGGLAAFTYSGTSNAAAIDTNAQTGAGTTTDATTNTDTTTTNGTTGLQAAPAPTATRHHTARVTSGGSGH